MPESNRVREVLLSNRVDNLLPHPLLYVFRVFFRIHHGLYRQLTCPTYGLTHEEMREECEISMNMRRALSMFIAEGRYQYVGVGFPIGESLREDVCADMEKVRSGHGEDIVTAVMRWIRGVQVRALQDFALADPTQFRRAWTVTNHEQWTDISKEWRKVLQTREDIDIGWVWAEAAPVVSPAVSTMRLKLFDVLHNLGDTLKIEDNHRWHTSASELGRLPGEEGVPPLECQRGPAVTPTAEYICDSQPESLHSRHEEDVRDTNFRDTTVGGNTVDVLLPPKPDKDLHVDTDTGNILAVKEPTSGVEKGSVFPEMPDLMLKKDELHAGEDPVLTLTQFHNTAHQGEDLNLRGDEFTQCPSFAQWAKDGKDEIPETPYKGVSIVAVQCSESTEVGDTVTTCRNLRDAFDEQEHLDVVTDSLVTLSQSICGGETRAVEATARSEIHMDVGDDAEVHHEDPWPHLEFASVDKIASMTLPDAYNYLQIEELLISLPGREGKADGADKVVFYNDKGKEIELRFIEIRNLMRLRTRLGNDIVDVVMSRLYFQCTERMRPEIQFVTSRISSCYTSVLQGKTTLQRWADVFLQPAKGVLVHEVRELLLPWVANDHWSLLVFQYDRVLHFDSYDGECHHPIGRHSEFVQIISHAWQTLRGVNAYDVPVVSQQVAQQPGNYECGHHTIRNALIYLKVRKRA